MSDHQTTASKVCPECGTPTSFKQVPKPRGPLHWRRTIPVLGVALVAIGLATVTWKSAWTWCYGPHMTERTTPTDFCEPPITLGDVRAFAAAPDAKTIPLADALVGFGETWYGFAPLDSGLYVHFAAPRGVRHDDVAYGKPFPWVRFNRHDGFADVFNRTGAWNSGDYDLDWPVPFNPGAAVAGLASTLLMFIAIWYATGLVLRIWRLEAQHPRRRLQLLVCAAAWMVLLVWSLVDPRREMSSGPYLDDDPAGTSLTFEDVLEIASGPDGDLLLAEELLRVSDPNAEDDLFLAAGFEFAGIETYMLTEIGWPIQVCELKAEEWVSPVWPVEPGAFHVRNGILTLTTAKGADRSRLEIYPASIGLLLFILWVAWIIARVVCFRAHGKLVRRRIEQGRCVVCAYPGCGRVRSDR